MMSLNRLKRVRVLVTQARRLWLQARFGMRIEYSASVSLSCRLVSGARGMIEVGPESLLAFKTLLDSRDPEGGPDRPIIVGRHCFVGGGAMLLPGVRVGDGSIVAAGAVVMEDVPPRSIVAGNPARVIRSDVELGPYGRLKGADENIRRYWQG